MTRFLVIVCCALVTSACASPGKHEAISFADDGGEIVYPVTTDDTVYTLKESADQFDAWATATYRNRSGQRIYYKRCNRSADGPMYRLRLLGPDGNVESRAGVTWACVGGVPNGFVDPGGSVSTRVWLGSTKSPDAEPPDRPEHRVGTFRIIFDLCRTQSSNDECELLPDGEARSNDFEIRFSGQQVTP